MKKNFIAAITMLMTCLTLLAMFASPVSAALRTCRTDPIFHFSNGDQLTVVLDVGADISSLSDISYVLHVPAGVTVTQVDYIPASLASIEKYILIQDSPAGVYTTNTQVFVSDPGKVDVTVSAQLNAFAAVSKKGNSGSWISVSVSAPSSTSTANLRTVRK